MIVRKAPQTALWLIAILPGAACAQVICALGPDAAAYKASADQRPSSDAMQLIGQTYAGVKGLCGASCPEAVLFRNATAANLMLIASGGQAKIVYKPEFMTGIYDRFGDAGVIALMSHELGHALDDTLGAAWVDKRWTAELRADAWAGCALAKANLTAGDLRSALSVLEQHPSPAHPAWSQRVPAIHTGYVNCGGTDAGFSTGSQLRTSGAR